MKKAVASSSNWRTKTTALYLPPAKLTTDNAAMIGAAVYLNFAKRKSADTNWRSIKAQGNLGL